MPILYSHSLIQGLMAGWRDLKIETHSLSYDLTAMLSAYTLNCTAYFSLLHSSSTYRTQQLSHMTPGHTPN